MLKHAGVAAVVGLAAALLVTSLGSSAPPGADPLLVEMLEGRLTDLEARLDALDSPAPVPTLRSAAPPPASDTSEAAVEELARRVDVLEKRLRAGVAPEGNAERSEAVARLSAEAQVEAWLERIRARPADEQPKEIYKVAMAMRKLGKHGLEERMFRALIEQAGPDAELAKEAVYQIGWTRLSAGDHQGAREAWLEARDLFPRDHYRFDYARYYAADAAVRMGDSASAARELEDLLDDLERGGNPERATILQRTRTLLASLRR